MVAWKPRLRLCVCCHNIATSRAINGSTGQKFALGDCTYALNDIWLRVGHPTSFELSNLHNTQPFANAVMRQFGPYFIGYIPDVAPIRAVQFHITEDPFHWDCDGAPIWELSYRPEL